MRERETEREREKREKRKKRKEEHICAVFVCMWFLNIVCQWFTHVVYFAMNVVQNVLDCRSSAACVSR